MDKDCDKKCVGYGTSIKNTIKDRLERAGCDEGVWTSHKQRADAMETKSPS